MPLEWTIKYEPKTLDEMVLNAHTRAQLSRVLKKECSVTLYSKPGMGKGTFTNIFLRETGCDAFWINASRDNGIGYIREHVEPFAYVGRGFSDKPKMCIFNEADRMTDESQSSLKDIIEKAGRITLFWFLTNNLEKMNDAILSRAPVIEFRNALEKDILQFVSGILRNEGVTFIEKTIQGYITRFKGDIRLIIKMVERNVVDGKLEPV